MPDQLGWSVRRDLIPTPPRLPWITTRYYTSPFPTGTSTATDNTRLRLVPIYVPNVAGVTVTQIGVELTVNGAAGSLMRLGIYKADPVTGLPTSLLLDGSTVATDAGASAFKSVTVSQFLRQGWYYLAEANTGGTYRTHINTVISEGIGFDSQTDLAGGTNQAVYGQYQCLQDATAVATVVNNGLPAHAPISHGGGGALAGTGGPRVMVLV